MFIPGMVDGFDYITVANGTRKWVTATGTIITGVFFGSALQGPIFKQSNVFASIATGFAGFWYFTGTVAVCVICGVLDSGSNQCDIRMDASGHITITRNGTVLATSSTTLSGNTWYHINPKFTVDGTAGAVDVHVNLSSFVSVSSANTKSTSNATFNQFVIDSNASRSQAFDHFIGYDTNSGGGNNPTTFLTGYHVVDASLVTGAGANADWTPSTGSNFQNVDEANSNDDTDYNSSATPGQIDTYAVANLRAGAGTILGIAINSMVRIDDATIRTCKHRTKSSSATADSSVITPSPTYQNYQTIVDVDPNTSAAPTVAGRNGMNFGVNEIS